MAPYVLRPFKIHFEIIKYWNLYTSGYDDFIQAQRGSRWDNRGDLKYRFLDVLDILLALI